MKEMEFRFRKAVEGQPRDAGWSDWITIDWQYDEAPDGLNIYYMGRGLRDEVQYREVGWVRPFKPGWYRRPYSNVTHAGWIVSYFESRPVDSTWERLDENIDLEDWK